MYRSLKSSPPELPLLDRLIDESLPLDQELQPSDRALDRSVNDPLERLQADLLRRDLARVRLEAIRRDLEVLLNARRSLVSLPEPAGELDRSVLDFGLSAPRGRGPTSASHRENLRKEVEAAIQRFEPRLANVRVALEVEQGPSERLRLRIDASLVGAGQAVLRAGLDRSRDRFELLEDPS
jgi:type VI secretion system protein ImpF